MFKVMMTQGIVTRAGINNNEPIIIIIIIIIYIHENAIFSKLVSQLSGTM